MAAPAEVMPVVRRVPPRPPAADRPAAGGRPRGLRPAFALVLGVLAAGAVVLGRTSGALENGVALLVGGLLVLLVPTSRDLCRRILLAGCLLLGFVPLLWWWPLPVDGVGRVTVGLALLAGGLAAWVGWDPVRRARRLIPQLRAVDLLVPVSIGVGLVELQTWLQVKTVRQTLGMLMSGWDNSAHFGMVDMIRSTGVTVDVLAPPPDGASWQFDSYPQGFHAVVATVMETMAGPVVGDIGSELFLYSRAVALMVIGATTMLVAGFCALPALRRRPGVAAPVAAFVMAVLYFGPGAAAIQSGIGNFTIACVLVVAIALVGIPSPRLFAPLPFAAIAGAVIGVASSWALLLVLAAPAVLVLLLPFRRRRWRARPLWIVVDAVLVLAVAAVMWRTLVVLSRVDASDPLTLTGGAPPVSVGLAVAAILGLLGGCVLVARGPGRRERLRVAALGLVALAAVATVVVLVVVQVDASGKATYYGFKFVLGVEIVLLLLLAVPVAHLVSRHPVRRLPFLAAARAALASVLVAVALTQVFGFTVADLAPVGIAPEAPGSANLAQQVRVLRTPPTTADLADRIMRAQSSGGLPPHAFYVDARPDRPISSILAAQWYLSLTDSWTVESNYVAGGTRFGDATVGAAAQVRWILATAPDTVALVPFESRYGVLKALNRPDLAYRVIGI